METGKRITQQYGLCGPAGAPSADPAPDQRLALWLTEREAECMVQLCVASLGYAGEPEERELFGMLGRYLRAFRVPQEHGSPIEAAA